MKKKILQKFLPDPSLPALTPRQLIFCKEYLIDHSATQAALRAGYSKKSAKQIGLENLTKPTIFHYIRAEISKQVARLDISAETVIREIARMALHQIEIKNSDRLHALELLAKHFDLLGDVKDKDRIGDTYINTIIGSFNGNTEKLSAADEARISEEMGLLQAAITA